MLILLSMVVALAAFFTAMLLLDPERRKKAIAVAVIAPLACGGLPASATHTQDHTPSCYERGLVPGWTPGSCITRFEQDVTLCDVSQFLSNTATLFGTASLFLSFTGFGGAFTGGIALVFGAMAIGTTLAGACSFESPPFEP